MAGASIDTENELGVETSQPGRARREPELRPRRRRAEAVRRTAGLTGRQPLARALGWFSIGLGLAEVLVPRALARLIGTPHHPLVFRAVGLREFATGVGILSQRRPVGWLWARVGGDIMDLVLLGAAFRSRKSQPDQVLATLGTVAGVTAADVTCALNLTRISRVKKSITINRPVSEVYQFWRDFRNLPRFMKNLQSVQLTAPERWHWVATVPGATTVEWDAEVIDDRPNELIAWRAIPGAAVDNAGTVRFRPAPGDRGTVVEVEMCYSPPGGKIGSLVAMLFGKEPHQQIQEDLRRFRQMLETGEIITTQGQPAGRRSSTSPLYDQTIR